MIHPASTIAQAPSVSRRNLWALARDYVALTKPKIILLLVLTATGAMFLAAEGSPPLSTVLLVLFGGGLAAGGANALNQYWDRDIDERMARTSTRPLPDQRIDPRNALYFGAALNVIAFVVLSSWVNLLAASLTLAATVFYVAVYTNWLKRSTTQNIVIGGAAGAIPPLVGWSAITGDLSLAALYMFAIVFFWTPPHFWALAVLLRNDYARAGVPMLPVVHGVEETGRQILLHSFTLVALSALFFTVEGLGWTYFGGALGLGAIFLGLALRFRKELTVKSARVLYLYSLLYLALLFGFIIIDSAA